MKFLVDRMLGRLAKWLRILGYDAAYFTGRDKDELYYQSLREGRIILSRDQRGISCSKGFRVVFIHADDFEEQIRELSKAVKIQTGGEDMFTRCVLCNGELERADKEKIREKVPPFVFETVEEFSHCSRCEKIYWKGSHWELAEGKLHEIRN